MHARGIDTMNPDFANTVGWQGMTAQVGAVYNVLPPAQRAHSHSDEHRRGGRGHRHLWTTRTSPQAISPHLNFWYWKPAHLNATTLVTVGYSRSDLRFRCGTVIRAGTVTVPCSIVNLLQGAPILVCSNLCESITAAWPRLKNFS